MKYLRFILIIIMGGCSIHKDQVATQSDQVTIFTGWRSEARSFQDCMSNFDPNRFTGCREHDYDNDEDVDLKDFWFLQSLDINRTADMPDSWIVLFNQNSPRSIEWKNWYMQLRGITESLGLNVSLNEKIDFEAYLATIHYPVLEHLKSNKKIMGIIVGFDVPGNFDLDSVCCSDPAIRAPRMDGGGGYSVSNALMSMSYTVDNHWETFPSPPNKHHFDVDYDPPGPSVNRFTLGSGMYITARLDGPTLEQVKALSPAVNEITATNFYYDKDDPSFGEWISLKKAVAYHSGLSWHQFNSDTEGTPGASFRFSWHRITNWDDMIWSSGVASTNVPIFAIDHNSFGATTVRSLTDHGARFVPNALFKGKFLAAAGATAEPLAGTQQDISTLIYHLDNCNLGEANFLATSHSQWMWELIGDPLLKIIK